MSYEWNDQIINETSTPEISVDNLIQGEDLLRMRKEILNLNFVKRCTANFYSVLSVWNSSMYNAQNLSVKSSNYHLDKSARFSIEFYSHHNKEWMTGV